MIVWLIIYILLFCIFVLGLFAIMQIKMAGIKVSDFRSFVEANQILDKLYLFAIQYDNMTRQEQIIYLKEAEKVFQAFDKVPAQLWEEDFRKYKEVLDKYQDIRLVRWNEQGTYDNTIINYINKDNKKN